MMSNCRREVEYELNHSDLDEWANRALRAGRLAGREPAVGRAAAAGEKIGLDESEWEDSPEALADWDAWIKTIEPMVWAEGEREEYERWREEVRKFNIEAVGKQMEEMGRDDEE